MKKLFKKIILSSLLLTVMFFVMPYFAYAASLIGSPHDMSGAFFSLGDGGSCATCHIPHKSTGGRWLWQKPNRPTGAEGVIGEMCAWCHANNAYGAAALIEASFSEKYVFPGIGDGKLSHGLKAEGAYEEGTLKSGLPYADKRYYSESEPWT
ncbi:hypothetical protein ACFL2A_01525 [Thermodesulfobacteriota bacterium]